MTFAVVTLILGVIGEGISIWGLISCLTDLNYLTATNLNGARRIVALQNISRQAFRMLMQMVLTVAGLVAIMIPRQAPILMVFFLIISLLISIAELNDRFRRVQLEHLYDKMHEVRLGRRKTDATLAAVHQELTGHPAKPEDEV